MKSILRISRLLWIIKLFIHSILFKLIIFFLQFYQVYYIALHFPIQPCCLGFNNKYIENIPQHRLNRIAFFAPTLTLFSQNGLFSTHRNAVFLLSPSDQHSQPEMKKRLLLFKTFWYPCILLFSIKINKIKQLLKMLKLTFFRWNNNLVMSKMMQRTVVSSMSKEKKTLLNVSVLEIYGTVLT